MVVKCGEDYLAYYNISYTDWKDYLPKDKKEADNFAAKRAKEDLYYIGSKIGAKVKFIYGPQDTIKYRIITTIGKIPTEDDIRKLEKQLDDRIAKYIKDQETIDYILSSHKYLGHYQPRYYGKCKYILGVRTPDLYAPIDTFNKVKVSIKNAKGVYDYETAKREYGYFAGVNKMIDEIYHSKEFKNLYWKFVDKHKFVIDLSEYGNPNAVKGYQVVDVRFVYEIKDIPSDIIKEYIQKIYNATDEYVRKTLEYKHLNKVEMVNNSTIRVIFK
jgi:hypothetical protein